MVGSGGLAADLLVPGGFPAAFFSAMATLPVESDFFTSRWVWLLVGSFLVGSIPFSWLVARAIGIDLLRQGSGNPGATNLSRLAGKKFGTLGMCLDVSKGAIPVLLCEQLALDAVQLLLVGSSSVLGHCFSPFLRGRGGKGVATTGGVLLVLEPWIAVTMLVAWGVARGTTGSAGMASVVAAATGVVISTTLLVASDQVADWLKTADGGTSGTVLGAVLLALSCLVIVRHHSNIHEYRQRRREESPR
ncbi:MAG: glycerol-3-phosphate 1-O-acyltransferase PlsY [Planctomycetota bacterium]